MEYSEDTRTKEQKELDELYRWMPERFDLPPDKPGGEITDKQKRQANAEWRQWCKETPDRKHSDHPPYMDVTPLYPEEVE